MLCSHGPIQLGSEHPTALSSLSESVWLVVGWEPSLQSEFLDAKLTYTTK